MPKKEQAIYPLAAAYCRLSREDAETAEKESESIQNQRALLQNYAACHGWKLYRTYADEGYSGMDRGRPAFNAMLEDAEAGKFQILLVKTQSRFTRDMELVEKYIHGRFPEWGIRFIAVVDHADTGVRGNKKARQISGLVNEWYLEDLSENIRAVLEAKRRTGQYLGGSALYGYRKNPACRGMLLPDETAAAVVRRIFAWCRKGSSTRQIAAKLDAAGILCPAAYKQSCGESYRNGRAGPGPLHWNAATVRRMLHNRMYLGDMVQGRSRKLSYKSKRVLSVPQQQWCVVPGTHAALVSRAEFAQAQRILAIRAKPATGGQPAWLRLVWCSVCGQKMTPCSNGHGGHYLRCRNHAKCHSSIRQDTLEQEVLRQRKKTCPPGQHPTERRLHAVFVAPARCGTAHEVRLVWEA